MDAVKETIADVRSVCLRQSSGEWLTLQTSTQLFCHGVYYPHEHTVDTPVFLPPRRRSCPVLLRAGITLISGKWDSPHLSFRNNGTYHDNVPEISKLVFARPGDRTLFWKPILLSLRLAIWNISATELTIHEQLSLAILSFFVYFFIQPTILISLRTLVGQAPSQNTSIFVFFHLQGMASFVSGFVECPDASDFLP